MSHTNTLTQFVCVCRCCLLKLIRFDQKSYCCRRRYYTNKQLVSLSKRIVEKVNFSLFHCKVTSGREERGTFIFRFGSLCFVEVKSGSVYNVIHCSHVSCWRRQTCHLSLYIFSFINSLSSSHYF